MLVSEPYQYQRRIDLGETAKEAMRIEQHSIVNQRFPQPRTMWLQQASAPTSSQCLVFLDAELYIERVKAPEILHRGQTADALPPLGVVPENEPIGIRSATGQKADRPGRAGALQ